MWQLQGQVSEEEEENGLVSQPLLSLAVCLGHSDYTFQTPVFPFVKWEGNNPYSLVQLST